MSTAYFSQPSIGNYTVTIYLARFAQFVDGSPHVTEEEVMQYSTWDSDSGEERYGVQEQQDSSTEEEEEEEEEVAAGHRFWCPLCLEEEVEEGRQLGHRFTCTLCGFNRAEVKSWQNKLIFLTFFFF